ncbi:MAG: hypothetical protein K2X54_21770, partial [Methylobacterium organophilum]|nr:hypothetical protein [Methylobacterium organophilum]
MPRLTCKPWRPDPNQMASGKPGAVQLRRGSFTGVVDLQATIKRYIAEHNQRARPFVWTKPATDILAAVSQSPEPSV